MARYIDEKNVYIDDKVKIGENVLIYPNVVIEGDTFIGNDCIIYSGTFIRNSHIGNGNEIYSSQIFNSIISNENKIGPFANIREKVTIGNNNKIGSFVELKNSVIGNNNKIPHHSYVGDAKIGDGNNIGAGVILANYDGVNKHETIIGDHSFIGCNSTIIAPITIGSDSFIAADTTVTKDVPNDEFAISRIEQINKINRNKNKD